MTYRGAWVHVRQYVKMATVAEALEKSPSGFFPFVSFNKGIDLDRAPRSLRLFLFRAGSVTGHMCYVFTTTLRYDLTRCVGTRASVRKNGYRSRGFGKITQWIFPPRLL